MSMNDEVSMHDELSTHSVTTPQVHVMVLTDTVRISTVHYHRDVSLAENADLADRIKSLLGPLTKTLDLPHIHVMAEGKRILLHGDVGTKWDAEKIEDTVADMAGVEAVESHLHVGLLNSDTRPSEAAPERSTMMSDLFDAAASVDICGNPAQAAVWGTLIAILEQIPPESRRHVSNHFPADVRTLLFPRRHLGDERTHWTTVLALDASAALRGGMRLESAEVLVPLVIGVLRKYIPEEDHAIHAILNTHLKELWQSSVMPGTV